MGDNLTLLRNVFGAADLTRRASLLQEGRKLIHYCSAENAVKIIKNKEMWLRNLRVMNDFMEVRHGFNLITRSLQTRSGSPVASGLAAVKAALDSVHPGVADKTFQTFQNWSPHIENETYVACLSEHMAGEQIDGRLSMWRNYSAGQSGVGIVINTELFGSDEDELGVYSSPVFYYADADLDELLLDAAYRIEQNREALSNVPESEIVGMYFLMLRSIAHGTKHPGFVEEREWRLFHTRHLDDLKILRIETETIAGVPQRVLKLPLDGRVAGTAAKDLIAGVLIGPSQHQYVIGMAITDELRNSGVHVDDGFVRYSPVPLRT